MRPLDATDVLRLWDACAALHPIDRTLAMLKVGSPDDTHDTLAALPIGERDRRAAALRVATFGPGAEGVHECPECGVTHEVAPPLGAILSAAPVGPEPWRLSCDGYDLIVRPVDSRDQAMITYCGDAAEAREQLLQRCVVAATCAGESVAIRELPAQVVAEISESMALHDGNAETLITLTCENCGRPWTIVFDVGEFLWRELSARARRLLREVDALARVYHWSERDVLAMSAQRRQTYLDLVCG